MAIQALQTADWEKKVGSALSLLDFWASWCGPCRMLAPILEEIETERPDLPIWKINVDEEPELAEAFGIMSIPALFVMKDGEIKAQTVGVQSKEDILALLESVN